MENQLENLNNQEVVEEYIKYLLVAILMDNEDKIMFDIDITETMYQEFEEAPNKIMYLVSLISEVYNFNIHNYRLVDYVMIDKLDENFDEEVNNFVKPRMDNGYRWN